MHATETALAQSLLDAGLVDELHALLWTEPFANKGTPDDGWSGRDHAVVVGHLLRSAGADVRIRHGRCMFVQGPGADGAPPVGIGQEGTSRVGHTWLHAAGLGDVDLSPRLGSAQPPWVPVDSPGVIGSTWVAGRETGFSMTTHLREYEAAIGRATGATDRLHAVYLMERDEPYTAQTGAQGPLVGQLARLAAAARARPRRRPVPALRGTSRGPARRRAPPARAASHTTRPGRSSPLTPR